jgi:hypothetical protein
MNNEIERLISVLTFRSANDGVQITTYEGGRTTVNMILGGRLAEFKGVSIVDALQVAEAETLDFVVTVEKPQK